MTANVHVDPGPITGVKDPSEWNKNLKAINVRVTARGKLSDRDRIFSSGKQVKTTFKYVA